MRKRSDSRVSSKSSQRTATSAGGVVYRRTENGVEIALVVRDAPRLVGLPKGTPDQGESIAETAVREVWEETGLESVIEAELGPIHYWFYSRSDQARYFKTVHHFLFRAVGGSTDLHDHEYDRVEWVPITSAPGEMTYANEADVVRRAAAVLDGLKLPR